MNRLRLEISDVAPPRPSEADLKKIGARFREIRGAKHFTRTHLANGFPPGNVLARAREICQLRYEPLPSADRDSLTDVVMTAVADVVADWLIERDRANARLSAWIDRTVADNRDFISVHSTRRRL